MQISTSSSWSSSLTPPGGCRICSGDPDAKSICLDCHYALQDVATPPPRPLPGASRPPSTLTRQASIQSIAGHEHPIQTERAVKMFDVTLIIAFFYGTLNCSFFALAVSSNSIGWQVFAVFALLANTIGINALIAHCAKRIAEASIKRQIFIFQTFVAGFSILAHVILGAFIFSSEAKSLVFALAVTTALLSYTFTLASLVHTLQYQ